MSNGSILEYEDLEHGEVAIAPDGLLHPDSACMTLVPGVLHCHPLNLDNYFSPTAIGALPRP